MSHSDQNNGHGSAYEPPQKRKKTEELSRSPERKDTALSTIGSGENIASTQDLILKSGDEGGVTHVETQTSSESLAQQTAVSDSTIKIEAKQSEALTQNTVSQSNENFNTQPSETQQSSQTNVSIPLPKPPLQRQHRTARRRKKSELKKKPPGDGGPFYCRACGAVESTEWRRGADGQKSLCNACGLHYAKILKKEKAIPPRNTPNRVDSLINPKEDDPTFDKPIMWPTPVDYDTAHFISETPPSMKAKTTSSSSRSHTEGPKTGSSNSTAASHVATTPLQSAPPASPLAQTAVAGGVGVPPGIPLILGMVPPALPFAQIPYTLTPTFTAQLPTPPSGAATPAIPIATSPTSLQIAPLLRPTPSPLVISPTIKVEPNPTPVDAGLAYKGESSSTIPKRAVSPVAHAVPSQSSKAFAAGTQASQATATTQTIPTAPQSSDQPSSENEKCTVETS